MALTANLNIRLQNPAALSTVNTQLANANRQAATLNQRFGQFRNVVNTAFAATAVVGFAGALARVSDQYTNVQNRIRLVTGANQSLVETQEQVIAIARRTRTSYEDTARTFSRVAIASRDAGVSLEESLQITETLNQALIVSGASVQEQQSALLQFSQAFASGVLQGEELRALRESAPLVATAFAEALGGSIEDLKAFAEEGLITRDVMRRALRDMRDDVESQFALVGTTIGQSLTNLRTDLVEFVGEFDEFSGATELVSSAIETLGDNLHGVGAGLAALGTGLAASGIVAFARLLARNPAVLAFLTASAGIGVAAQAIADEPERQDVANQIERESGRLAAVFSAGETPEERVAAFQRYAELRESAVDQNLALGSGSLVGNAPAGLGVTIGNAYRGITQGLVDAYGGVVNFFGGDTRQITDRPTLNVGDAIIERSYAQSRRTVDTAARLRDVSRAARDYQGGGVQAGLFTTRNFPLSYSRLQADVAAIDRQREDELIAQNRNRAQLPNQRLIAEGFRRRVENERLLRPLTDRTSTQLQDAQSFVGLSERERAGQEAVNELLRETRDLNTERLAEGLELVRLSDERVESVRAEAEALFDIEESARRRQGFEDFEGRIQRQTALVGLSGRELEVQRELNRLIQRNGELDEEQQTRAIQLINQRIDAQEMLAREELSGNIQRGFEQEIRLLGLSNQEREVASRLLQIENQYREQGIPLTQAQSAAYEAQIRSLQETREELRILNEFTETLSSSIGNSLSRAFESGEFSVRSFARTAIAELSRIGIRNFVTNPLSNFLGGFFGGASVAHTGGIIGQTTFPTRSVDPFIFAQARRFHEGLRPNEFPAILERGEEVLSRGDSRNSRNGGDSRRRGVENVNIILPNVQNPDAFAASETQIARTGRGVLRSVNG